MNKPRYQQNLSLQSPILLDRNYKRAKVEKMLAILEADAILPRPTEGLALDVGCSGGLFADALKPYFSTVIGLDIDAHALRLAHRDAAGKNPLYILGDSLHIPLPDASVDLVICNHTYEHVPNAVGLFNEIYRVMSSNGACYLGAASRLCLMEPHYHLPLLSWLPKWLAHRYLRLMGKGEHYYENLRTYWGLRGLVSRFHVQDYTVRVINEPDQFEARDLIPQESVVRKVPRFFWNVAYPFLPAYLFVLRKRFPICKPH